MCDIEPEVIPDLDPVHRQVDQPTGVSPEGKTMLDKTFPLSQDKESKRRYESLTWSKYAPTPADVHKLGLARVEKSNVDRIAAGKEAAVYFGFGTAQAGEVRHKKIGRGYGFTITHTPNEGRSHVDIDLIPPEGANLKKIPVNDRSEIMEFLSVIFFGENDARITRFAQDLLSLKRGGDHLLDTVPKASPYANVVAMQWMWTWAGKSFGYRDGEDLWTYSGKHIGKFHDDEVYGPDGRYLGEVMSGNRLIRHRAKANWRKWPFRPWAKRVGYVPYVNYVGYVMYAGYEDFPPPEAF